MFYFYLKNHLKYNYNDVLSLERVLLTFLKMADPLKTSLAAIPENRQISV